MCCFTIVFGVRYLKSWEIKKRGSKKREKIVVPDQIVFYHSCACFSAFLRSRFRSKLGFPTSPSKYKKKCVSFEIWSSECRDKTNHILPILQISVSLSKLGGEVDRMATKEKVVLGCNGEGVAHENSRVDDQSAGHVSGDAVCFQRYLRLVLDLECSQLRNRHMWNGEENKTKEKKTKNSIHLGILLCIHHGSDGDAEIRYGAPEI